MKCGGLIGLLIALHRVKGGESIRPNPTPCSRRDPGRTLTVLTPPQLPSCTCAFSPGLSPPRPPPALSVGVLPGSRVRFLTSSFLSSSYCLPQGSVPIHTSAQAPLHCRDPPPSVTGPLGDPTSTLTSACQGRLCLHFSGSSWSHPLVIPGGQVMGAERLGEGGDPQVRPLPGLCW